MTIEGPFGEFSYLNHSSELYLYMIAGGVGITPMMSMLRHLRQSNHQRPVVLLWGVRKSSELLFDREIKEMMDEMNNLTIIPVLSDAPEHRGEKGYIDQKLIEKYLLNTGFQIDHTGFYICGPPILRRNSIRALKQMGIHKKKIHYEAFSM
jgi:ferredoxin-NADP reductase